MKEATFCSDVDMASRYIATCFNSITSSATLPQGVTVNVTQQWKQFKMFVHSKGWGPRQQIIDCFENSFGKNLRFHKICQRFRSRLIEDRLMKEQGNEYGRFGKQSTLFPFRNRIRPGIVGWSYGPCGTQQTETPSIFIEGAFDEDGMDGEAIIDEGFEVCHKMGRIRAELNDNEQHISYQHKIGGISIGNGTS